MSLGGSTSHPRYVPCVRLSVCATHQASLDTAATTGGGIIRQSEYGSMGQHPQHPQHRSNCTLLARERLMISRAEDRRMELFSRAKHLYLFDNTITDNSLLLWLCMLHVALLCYVPRRWLLPLIDVRRPLGCQHIDTHQG